MDLPPETPINPIHPIIVYVKKRYDNLCRSSIRHVTKIASLFMVAVTRNSQFSCVCFPDLNHH